MRPLAVLLACLAVTTPTHAVETLHDLVVYLGAGAGASAHRGDSADRDTRLEDAGALTPALNGFVGVRGTWLGAELGAIHHGDAKPSRALRARLRSLSDVARDTWYAAVTVDLPRPNEWWITPYAKAGLAHTTVKGAQTGARDPHAVDDDALGLLVGAGARWEVPATALEVHANVHYVSAEIEITDLDTGATRDIDDHHVTATVSLALSF